jgi:methionine--tRNA ligase beta chain
MIKFNDFKKLDIRIGKILSAEKVENADKLLKLRVDVGEERQLIAGIAETYSPEDLVGKEIPVLVNLEPAKIKGVESNGMILAIEVDGKAILINPDKEVKPGSKVR